jgi:hypothetical protein
MRSVIAAHDEGLTNETVGRGATVEVVSFAEASIAADARRWRRRSSRYRIDLPVLVSASVTVLLLRFAAPWFGRERRYPIVNVSPEFALI